LTMVLYFIALVFKCFRQGIQIHFAHPWKV
jgi:hypothetical protein